MPGYNRKGLPPARARLYQYGIYWDRRFSSGVDSWVGYLPHRNVRNAGYVPMRLKVRHGIDQLGRPLLDSKIKSKYTLLDLNTRL